MGFNIVLGGYMSIKRVADAVDADLWIPATVDNAVEVCGWVGLLWDSYGTPSITPSTIAALFRLFRPRLS